MQILLKEQFGALLVKKLQECFGAVLRHHRFLLQIIPFCSKIQCVTWGQKALTQFAHCCPKQASRSTSVHPCPASPLALLLPRHTEPSPAHHTRASAPSSQQDQNDALGPSKGITNAELKQSKNAAPIHAEITAHLPRNISIPSEGDPTVKAAGKQGDAHLAITLAAFQVLCRLCH